MNQITKLRKEIEAILTRTHNPADITYWDGCLPELMDLFEHSLQEAKEEERERIIDEIEPRLYSLWANIDYVYNKRAREQAMELLCLLEELT